MNMNSLKEFKIQINCIKCRYFNTGDYSLCPDIQCKCQKKDIKISAKAEDLKRNIIKFTGGEK